MRARRMDVSEDCYLTDGQRLFRVLRTWRASGQVLLEDAGDPSLPALIRNVKELAADGIRVVRPAS